MGLVQAVCARCSAARITKHPTGVACAIAGCAVLTTVTNQPGQLSGLTKVLADHNANITYVDIIDHPDRQAQIYLEFSLDGEVDAIVGELGRVHGVSHVEVTQ